MDIPMPWLSRHPLHQWWALLWASSLLKQVHWDVWLHATLVHTVQNWLCALQDQTTQPLGEMLPVHLVLFSFQVLPPLVCVILQTITENLETGPWTVLASIDCCFFSLTVIGSLTGDYVLFFTACVGSAVFGMMCLGIKNLMCICFMYCVCDCQLLSFPESLHLCGSTTIKWARASPMWLCLLI